MTRLHFPFPARTRHRIALCGLLAVAGLHPAAGMTQTPDSTRPDGTELELSATGTVQAPPDELTATFVAEAQADTAAAAQAQLNALISAAIATTAHTDGLEINAESYFVHHDEGDVHQNRKPRWVARQGLRLTAADGKVLLPLVGRIQAENLALTRLDWSLSRARRAELTRKAETLALEDMQARAQAAAATLRLRVVSIRSVALEEQNFPRPMPMMMMARMASADGAAPEAPTGQQDVTATARATVILKP